MIKILNKQSYSSNVVFLCALLVLLVALFAFASFLPQAAYYWLSLFLIICVISLLPFRSRIFQKQAYRDLQIQELNEKINLIDVEIESENEAIQSFRSKIVDSSELKILTEKLSLCLTLEDTSKALSGEVNVLFGDRNTTIIMYLFHSKTGELGVSSSQKGQMKVNVKSKKGDEFDQWVVKTMQPLLIEDTKKDYRFDIDKISTTERRPIRSLICAPFISGNKILGILRVDSPNSHHFGIEDLRFLTTIADLGMLAIENAQLYERIQQLAIRDSLTNLYLRRFLMERLPQELVRHSHEKDELALLMMDLDHFKAYNDKFGHMAGDIVIKTVAGLMAENFKGPGDLVCRYGGEEFVVMIPNCNQERACELAEMIRQKVESQDVILRREKTNMTISVGVAIFPGHGAEKDTLIHSADQALYEAKEQGRNRVCLFKKKGKKGGKK